ncbi:UTRA domain-containing protein [Streptomyces sp. CRCS-T-1]|uniref:UTRA domain-containing protein n=1 Tax=Streptomyces TaxID=1883 RepID=UPI0035230A56
MRPPHVPRPDGDHHRSVAGQAHPVRTCGRAHRSARVGVQHEQAPRRTVRAGVGTDVAEPGQRVRVVRSSARERPDVSPFRADMKAVDRQGDWESRTEAKVPAPADIAARLGIAEGDLCVRTTYEFLADGRPVQLSTSWEPYDLTAGTLVVLPEGGPHAGAGVVNRMAAIGVSVSHAVEQPEPRQATAEEASLLGIQKAALVTHIRRTYYSNDGRPVETADIVVPAAHCEIVYEIPINRH